MAIEKAGVETRSFDIKYPARRCYSNLGHDPKHILSAQELAKWMKDKSDVFGDVDVKSSTTSKDYSGKKGLVFIKNGWGSMDPIDLWDGSSMKGGEASYFSAGEEVWFWELS